MCIPDGQMQESFKRQVGSPCYVNELRELRVLGAHPPGAAHVHKGHGSLFGVGGEGRNGFTCPILRMQYC